MDFQINLKKNHTSIGEILHNWRKDKNNLDQISKISCSTIKKVNDSI